MRFLRSSVLSFSLLVAVSTSLLAGEFEFRIPIVQQSSGNFYVAGTLENDDEAEFLVDTGAGMVILSEKTFQSLNKSSKQEVTKRIALRMADGRSKAVNVYTLSKLILGQACNVGPVEVAVIPGGVSNILGLNVLKKAAPFAIYTSPPSLALSACAELPVELARHLIKKGRLLISLPFSYGSYGWT